MRLDKTDLNYSRTAGMFVLEQGKSTWAELDHVSRTLSSLKGIEAVEGCKDEGWITMCYNKQWYDWDGIRDEYKAAKKAADFERLKAAYIAKGGF